MSEPSDSEVKPIPSEPTPHDAETMQTAQNSKAAEFRPFTSTGYVLRTAFWVFVLPGLVCSTPFVVIAGIVMLSVFLGALFQDSFDFVVKTGFVLLGYLLVLSLLILFYSLFYRFRRRFEQNLQAGNIPESFSLRILPFFLPLFYILLLAAVAFCFAPFSTDRFSSADILSSFAFAGLPQYAGLTILVVIFLSAFNSYAETVVVIPFIIAVCTALAGLIYTCTFKPRAKHCLSGAAMQLALVMFLAFAACGCHRLFRKNVLPPLQNNDPYEVVREEENRNFRDETDLDQYVPFSKDNQLVKIESPTLQIDSEHPRIHGAFALYPVYAAAVEAVYRKTEKFDFSRWQSHKSYDLDIDPVKSGTTPEAFEALLNGESDMIFSLDPSDKQKKEAEARGLTLSVTPIGYEAFVFFVSKENPVEDLTQEQIRKIYAKRITNWREVGGKNKRILPFQRPEGSGSQTMVLRIMGDVPISTPQREEFQISMGGIVNRVADYRNYGNAIGFSFRYYVEGLFKHDGVKLLRVDGVEPSIENIQSGKYPFPAQLTIVTAGSKNPNVPELIRWFQSPQGQELIRRVGYVPRDAAER
jgi:phosphate transport system substrate-binding protein